MELSITTLPAEADSFETRTLVLGAGLSGKITYVIEIEDGPGGEDDEPIVNFLLSNAPGVATEGEAVEQHIEILAAALETLQEAVKNV